MNILRILPVAIALFAASGTARAEETSSFNPKIQPFDHTIEVNLGVGAAGLSAASSDFSYGGAAAGVEALYFTKSGFGFGGRVVAAGDAQIFGGNASGSIDGIVAYRPWQRERRYQLVPTFFVGGGWLEVEHSRSTGLCLEQCGPSPAPLVAHAGTAVAGASLDMHLGYFVVGLEGAGRAAIVGDPQLGHAAGYTAMLHLGADFEF